MNNTSSILLFACMHVPACACAQSMQHTTHSYYCEF